MFIEPIIEDLGAGKAAVALVGSLLSGCYLLVGPFVSGKFTFCYSQTFIDVMLSLYSSHKSIWLPHRDNDWIRHRLVCFRIELLRPERALFAYLLWRHGRCRVLLHLHAVCYYCRLLL